MPQQSYSDSPEIMKYPIEEELEKYREYARVLAPHILDGVWWLNNEMQKGKKVLVEGANAALLDIDFGTYPFVTSSSTTAGGICTGLGIPPNNVQCIIGVVKAFLTRVGNGPFPSECTSPDCRQAGWRRLEGNDNDETAEYFEGWQEEQDAIRTRSGKDFNQGYVGDYMRDMGFEYGTTTGRPRRCGWLDIPLTAFAHELNGYSSINITKLDVLSGLKDVKIGVSYRLDGVDMPLGQFPDSLHDLQRIEVVYETLPGWDADITGCTGWAQLPKNAQRYLNRIEELLKVPIAWIGVGPDREAMFSSPRHANRQPEPGVARVFAANRPFMPW